MAFWGASVKIDTGICQNIKSQSHPSWKGWCNPSSSLGLSTMDLLKKDHELLKFKYGVLEDPNFSAENNQKIIARTIQKSEMARINKMKVWNESMRDRADAVASFLKHVDSGKHNNVVNYFGRKELARLRGEDILTQLKGSVFKKNGQA